MAETEHPWLIPGLLRSLCQQLSAPGSFCQSLAAQAPSLGARAGATQVESEKSGGAMIIMNRQIESILSNHSNSNSNNNNNNSNNNNNNSNSNKNSNNNNNNNAS